MLTSQAGHTSNPALTPAWRTALAPSTWPAALQALLKLLKISPSCSPASAPPSYPCSSLSRLGPPSKSYFYQLRPPVAPKQEVAGAAPYRAITIVLYSSANPCLAGSCLQELRPRLPAPAA